MTCSVIRWRRQRNYWKTSNSKREDYGRRLNTRSWKQQLPIPLFPPNFLRSLAVFGAGLLFSERTTKRDTVKSGRITATSSVSRKRTLSEEFPGGIFFYASGFLRSWRQPGKYLMELTS